MTEPGSPFTPVSLQCVGRVLGDGPGQGTPRAGSLRGRSEKDDASPDACDRGDALRGCPCRRTGARPTGGHGAGQAVRCEHPEDVSGEVDGRAARIAARPREGAAGEGPGLQDRRRPGRRLLHARRDPAGREPAGESGEDDAAGVAKQRLREAHPRRPGDAPSARSAARGVRRDPERLHAARRQGHDHRCRSLRAPAAGHARGTQRARAAAGPAPPGDRLQPSRAAPTPACEAGLPCPDRLGRDPAVPETTAGAAAGAGAASPIPARSGSGEERSRTRPTALPAV